MSFVIKIKINVSNFPLIIVAVMQTLWHLAKYVVALAKKDKTEEELRALCMDQLGVFLVNGEHSFSLTSVCTTQEAQHLQAKQ